MISINTTIIETIITCMSAAGFFCFMLLVYFTIKIKFKEKKEVKNNEI